MQYTCCFFLLVDAENPPMNFSCQKEVSDEDGFVSILLTWSVDEITLLSIKNFKVSLQLGELGDEESFVNESQYIQELEVRKKATTKSYTILAIVNK